MTKLRCQSLWGKKVSQAFNADEQSTRNYEEFEEASTSDFLLIQVDVSSLLAGVAPTT
jgi:hypothetical protein